MNLNQYFPMNRFALLLSLLTFTTLAKSQVTGQLPAYHPTSQALHDKIVKMDSLLFSAYNHCELEIFEQLFDEDIEFYHDQGGLSTSKPDLIAALKKNICGKVTRELITGSIEVYPIPGYGAIQMGWHQFHNKLEPDSKPHPSKFVTIWKQDGDHWKITRVISLH